MAEEQEETNSQEHEAHVAFEAIAVGPSLTVASLEQSMAWYRDVLGFAVERVYEREGRPMAVALRAGSIEMLLTRLSRAARAAHAAHSGASLYPVVYIARPGAVMG